MAMFDEATSTQLSKILEGMNKDVKIILFKDDSEKSKECETFVTEFEGFSPKLSLEVFTAKDEAKVQEWSVYAYPAMYVTTGDESMKGISFYGTPGGYEINSFVMSLLEVSGHKEALSAEHQGIVDKVSTNLELVAFISLTCPQCPQAVMNIHRVALENTKIKASMIEAPAFKEYAESQKVTAFPTVIVHDIDNKKVIGTLIGENAKDFNQLIDLLK